MLEQKLQLVLAPMADHINSLSEVSFSEEQQVKERETETERRDRETKNKIEKNS